MRREVTGAPQARGAPSNCVVGKHATDFDMVFDSESLQVRKAFSARRGVSSSSCYNNNNSLDYLFMYSSFANCFE